TSATRPSNLDTGGPYQPGVARCTVRGYARDLARRRSEEVPVLIENEFTSPAPIDHLWAYLLDVERVAPCMPGAELTETIDDRNWKGKVSMKFGPVSMSFAGSVTLEERDEA